MPQRICAHDQKLRKLVEGKIFCEACDSHIKLDASVFPSKLICYDGKLIRSSVSPHKNSTAAFESVLQRGKNGEEFIPGQAANIRRAKVVEIRIGKFLYKEMR